MGILKRAQALEADGAVELDMTATMRAGQHRTRRARARATSLRVPAWALSVFRGKNIVSVGSQTGQQAVFSGAYS